MSRSGITMARLTVLVDFDALIAFYDVDFRVMLLVVGLKVGWLINLMLDSASDSALDSVFDLGVSEMVGSVIQFVVASSASLKVISRLDIT